MDMNLREQEPGLYEVLHPLVVRWKLLAGSVLIAIVIAGIVTFLQPKQYEATCLLSIGMAVDKGLEDTFTVTQIVNSDSFQQAAAAKAGLTYSPGNIVAETDTARWMPWINIRAKADDPQKAVKLVNAVADGILERHNKFFDGKIQRYRDYKTELEKSIDEFTQEIATLRQNLNTYPSTNPDLSARMLLQTRLSDKENQIIMFKRELRDVNTALSEVHTRRTTSVAKPVLPRTHKKPSLKMNLVIATVATIFLMISFILIWEQYRKGSRGI